MENFKNGLKLEQGGVAMWNMVCTYRNQRLSTDGSFLLIFPIDQH